MYKAVIAAVLVLGTAGILYFAGNRNVKIENEESEIKTVLESLRHSESERFKDQGAYTDEISDFYVKTPKRPTIIGVFPDCEGSTSELPHIFIGPIDEKFKAQARDAIEKAELKGKCSNLQSSFTVFVAQDLDGDNDLELWTMDNDGRTKVVLSD